MTITTTGIMRESGIIATGGLTTATDQILPLAESLLQGVGLVAGDSVPARTEEVVITNV